MPSLSTFSKLLKFLWEHPDQLLHLLETLVATMNLAGQGMENAGNGAIQASRVFKGGPGVPVSASQAVEGAADAIEAAKAQIRLAADVIEDAANAIGSIKVPSLDPVVKTLPSVFKWPDGSSIKVVTGVTVTQTSAFTGVKSSLQTGSNRIDDFGDDLQATANNLHQFSSSMAAAGQDLQEMGVALRDTGLALQEATEEDA